MKKKEPKIGQFLDAEEQTLVEAIEDDAYQVDKNHATPKRLEALRDAVHSTMNEDYHALRL